MLRKLKAQICTFALLAVVNPTIAGPISWAPSEREGLTSFWQSGVYEVLDNGDVHFMGELPTKTKKWGAGWVKGEKHKLPTGSRIRLGQEFRLTGWKNGPISIALLFIEAETGSHGKGWALLAANVPGVHPLQVTQSWPNLTDLWGEPSGWLRGPIVKEDWTFSVDDSGLKHLALTVTGVGDGVGVEIENTSGRVLQILWDKSSFVGPDGYADGVIHVGTKLADKGGSQPPTVLPPGAKRKDAIVPKGKVSWADGWVFSPLFSGEDSGTFKVVLAVDVDGEEIFETASVEFKVDREEPPL